MSPDLLMQWLIVAGLVAWSLWRVARLFMPSRTAANAGCGSGCNTCGSCASNPQLEQPVQWRQPPT